MASRMRQREWEEKGRRVGGDSGRGDFTVPSAGLEEVISIPGDVDVRGTIEIVFLTLLSPTCANKQKNSILAAPLRYVPHKSRRLSRSPDSTSVSIST